MEELLIMMQTYFLLFGFLFAWFAFTLLFCVQDFFLLTKFFRYLSGLKGLCVDCWIAATPLAFFQTIENLDSSLSLTKKLQLLNQCEILNEAKRSHCCSQNMSCDKTTVRHKRRRRCLSCSADCC